jgi:AraC family transcriptional activator FtrA
VLLVDDGSNPFEVGCACEIFGARRRAELGFEPYSFRMAAPGGTARMRDGMFRMTDVRDLSAIRRADTLVVPNRPDVSTPSRPDVLRAVAGAHRRGVRLVGLCTGAYTLAEAGVLDGRPAAVHWQLADDFRTRFPGVQVRPDVLYVDDGDVLTSAGSAAALDLGLHIVRRDYGATVANRVSRRLVFAAFRDGGQQQFVERAVPAVSDRSLAATLSWARAHLDEPLTVARLAEQAHVSPTTLHRRFRAELGMTPLAWLTAERVDLACQLLEQAAGSVDAVAGRSGLGTASNLRTLLRRRTGLTPAQYQARFAHRPDA